MRFIIAFLTTAIFFSFADAATKNIYGQFEGITYDYYINDDNQNIYGKVGETKFDLYFKTASENIYGTIGEKRIDVYLKSATNNLYGSLPCGKIDVYFKAESRNIYGVYCEKPRFDNYYPTVEEYQRMARHLIIGGFLVRIVDIFPPPYRETVIDQIKDWFEIAKIYD